jgi:hypothetical protein
MQNYIGKHIGHLSSEDQAYVKSKINIIAMKSLVLDAETSISENTEAMAKNVEVAAAINKLNREYINEVGNLISKSVNDKHKAKELSDAETRTYFVETVARMKERDKFRIEQDKINKLVHDVVGINSQYGEGSQVADNNDKIRESS